MVCSPSNLPLVSQYSKESMHLSPSEVPVCAKLVVLGTRRALTLGHCVEPVGLLHDGQARPEETLLSHIAPPVARSEGPTGSAHSSLTCATITIAHAFCVLAWWWRVGAAVVQALGAKLPLMVPGGRIWPRPASRSPAHLPSKQMGIGSHSVTMCYILLTWLHRSFLPGIPRSPSRGR